MADIMPSKDLSASLSESKLRSFWMIGSSSAFLSELERGTIHIKAMIAAMKRKFTMKRMMPLIETLAFAEFYTIQVVTCRVKTL